MRASMGLRFATSGSIGTNRDLLGAGHSPLRDQENQAAFGRFAPYFERDCLRSLTPWVSSEPRTMW
jgi:hypothetical protein